MIQEIRIKNFRSFKDEVIFSFEASKDTFAEDYQVVKINDKVRLLRFAIVYGYNASGKSNLLQAIEFLRTFWFSQTKDLNQKITIEPFKLDANSPKEHSRFEIVFYVESTKYTYLLELDKQQVYIEKLSYYKSEQPTMLFDRRFENGQSIITFNQSLKISKIVKENITVNCLKNMSVFAARNQVNAIIPFIDAATNYLNYLVWPSLIPSKDLTSYAKKILSEDKEMVEYMLGFLHEADFNITDLQTYTEENNVIKASLSHSVENERGKETYRLSLDDGEESMGTVRTLGIESLLYGALKGQAFLAFDEIENSLHPKLLEKILFDFLKQENSQSQLVVTTHNDGLLDLIDDLIRKDSVWFTEKRKDGSTDLFKLTDFKGLNRITSIREAYRLKRFGATMN